MAQSVSHIDGIDIERPDVAPLIDEAIRHVLNLRRSETTNRSLRFALTASLGSINALLSAAASKCTIGGPPADIDMVADSNGDLIYQCHHNPTHKWDLNGHRI